MNNLKFINNFFIVISKGIVLFLFLTNGTNLFAQKKLPPKLKFNSITVENGLPNNIVNSIIQDSVGYVWIATNDGLCRFDGKNYKTFRHSIENKNSISNNFIQSLFVDSKGDLWIMTDQGLNRFDIKKEVFEIYYANGNGGLSHNSPTSMVERSNGEYIIGTYGGGIDILKDGQFIYNYKQENNFSISSNLISSLQIQNDSILWVGNWKNGLNKINLESKKVTKFTYGFNEITSSGEINTLYLDAENYLWIGTNAGLTIYNTKSDSFFKINVENCSSFSDNDILSIFEDNEGVIWLGTRNSGIIKGNRKEILSKKQKNTFVNYLPNDFDDSVNYRSISSFYQDNQNNIWIGTHLLGVNIVNPNGESFRFYNNLAKDNSKSSYKSTWGISEDNNDNIWVGTDGGGLYKFNPFNNNIEKFVADPLDNNSISDNAILSSYFDSKGNLWIGTYAGGLNVLKSGSKKFKHYKKGLSNKNLNSNDIRVIFEDSKQRIWIGTNGGGLHLYKPETDDFKFITEVGWLDIRSLTEDLNGNLWIGTFGNGILSFNYEKNKTETYPEYDKLKAHIVFDVECVSEEDLWIGTRFEGLIHFNLKTKKITQYTEDKGISNNTVNAIVAESKSKLLISTNNGLNLFNVEDETFDSFISANGVRVGSFNGNSGFISKNGYAVFGALNGLNIFYPDEIYKDYNPLKIVFTDFKLFNKSIDVSNEINETPLKQSLSTTTEIELDYSQDVITIEYGALNFPSSKGINYEYILENYDTHWNKVGANTSATYRNLSPGEYVFKVKLAHELEDKNQQISKIKIIIHPPFWLTLPAVLIYIISISFIIVIVLKYYANQIKLRNSLFYTQILREQEKDLNKERFRFFTNFSHELRTPLTLILGPISDILREEKKGKHTSKLKLIKRNSQILLELINKMLEFRKSETEHNHLEVGKYNFTQFLKEISSNFKFYAAQKEIEFNVEIENEYQAWFDYKKIQLVIFNLLSNAFKYTPKGGEIKITVQEVSNTILLKIADTGSGIKQEALDSIFNLYYHKDNADTIEGTGIGLALCKKLMDLHQGEILVESKIGVGSCFKIELFKNKDHFSKIKNVEFIDSKDFIIKKPFIDETLLLHNEPIQFKFNKNDKVVLIVDDNQDIINYLNEILSESFKVVSAKNGKIGVEKAFEIIPDLIISDIMMPEKSGMDLCKELKNSEKTSHVPIILLTAKLGDSDRLEGVEIGADDYITKPFDSNFLLAKIENIFSNRKKLINFYSDSEITNPKLIDPLKNIEDKFLAKLEQLVFEKYNGDILIPELAKELGYSRSSLYRKVKAVTGSSVSDYIKRVRLNKAAKLLVESDFNVSQAAFDSGFNDVKYFSVSFKKQFGISPSKYKAENLNNKS
ncbi:response regulator [Lutibacter sp. A80]|uniref:hybrid sensor histidine kinase/response regulator transcription factor n=1 Tax=Lutibacter sp. A80 TaxID=2918453 RepID=UPI001F0587E3|nr:hybrid sensor histidine kinase/response regulator transcription factor [Lutibacter sp. A80]UMB59168.1 response regulator [Lutibacter sp. A80]